MKKRHTKPAPAPAGPAAFPTIIKIDTHDTISRDFLALCDDMGDLNEEHAWRAALADAALRGDGAAIGRTLDAYRVRLDLLVATGAYDSAIQSGLWSENFADLPADQLDVPLADSGNGDRRHWLQRIVRHLRGLHRAIDPSLDAFEAEVAEMEA